MYNRHDNRQVGRRRAVRWPVNYRGNIVTAAATPGILNLWYVLGNLLVWYVHVDLSGRVVILGWSFRLIGWWLRGVFGRGSRFPVGGLVDRVFMLRPVVGWLIISFMNYRLRDIRSWFRGIGLRLRNVRGWLGYIGGRLRGVVNRLRGVVNWLRGVVNWLRGVVNWLRDVRGRLGYIGRRLRGVVNRLRDVRGRVGHIGRRLRGVVNRGGH